MEYKDYFWVILRISMGWLFLWAFFDKLLGLGFSTTYEKSWIAGASPTSGFLQFGAKGFFADIFHNLAGSQVVDYMFMVGILCIGLSLLLGIGLRIACYGGMALSILMWLAVFPPQNNPIFDEHIIYVIGFFGISLEESTAFSFTEWWRNTELVRRYPILG